MTSCSPMVLISSISLVILVIAGDLFPPTLTHFPTLFFLFLWILFITKYYNMSTAILRKRFSVFKRLKLESNTREDAQ